MQPLCKLRIDEARIGEAHDGAAIAHQQSWIGFREAFEAELDPIRIEVETPRVLLGAHAEHVLHRLAFRRHADRADEREACKPRCVAHRKLGGYPSAERRADEVYALEPK